MTCKWVVGYSEVAPKCQSRFDCLEFKLFSSKKLKPNLNEQKFLFIFIIFNSWIARMRKSEL